MDVYKIAWGGVYYIKNGSYSGTHFWDFVMRRRVEFTRRVQAGESMKKTSSFVVKTLLSGKQIKTTRSMSEGY